MLSSDLPSLALLQLDARAQAAEIRAGRLSCAQLVAAQQRAVATLDADINAYVQRVPDGEIEAAIRSQIEKASSDVRSNLRGATFAVKDNIDVAGLPTHAGLKALAAKPADADAKAVQRLRQAGMILLGKVNMHAMALGATNHNVDFGDCRNPRRLSHTPGGSSGGSGAAVAAGLCSLALGTDTMGSVRVPASYCGVVGFKPSFDAIPTDGLLVLSTPLDHIGVLARSVGDCVEAFAWLSGDASSSADSSSQAQYEFLYPSDLAALGAEESVCKAFEAALTRLRGGGFRLKAVDIDATRLSRIRHAGLLLCEAELADSLASVMAERREQIPAELLQMLEFGERMSSAKLSRAMVEVVHAQRWLNQLTSGHDGLLLPTTPQSSFAMSDPVPRNQPDFTAPANMSGAPAISIPMPVADDALPIGLQLIGHRDSDAALLRAAVQAERALAA